jgi:hypothetical protein
LRKVSVILTKDGSKFGYSSYQFSQPKFAFISKFESGRVRRLSSFHSCREYLCQDFLKKMRRSWRKDTWNSEIDTKRLRLAIWTQTKYPKEHKIHHEKAKQAVKVLNIIEKHLKWPLTKLYQLESDNMNANSALSMVVASCKWLRTQHLLSFYTLVFRFAFMANFKFSQVKGWPSLKKAMPEAAIANYSSSRIQSDAGYLKRFLDIMGVLENYDRIFRPLPMSRNYSMKAIGNQDQCFSDGISNLMKGYSNDSELKKRIKEATQG